MGLKTVALIPLKADYSHLISRAGLLKKDFILVHLPKRTLLLGQKEECMSCVYKQLVPYSVF